MTYFEFTDAVHPKHDNVRQIRALTDQPTRGVKAGDIGGWITSAANLADKAWISRDAVVVSSGVRLSGRAFVSGNAVLGGNAVVKDRALVAGNVRLYGNVVVKDHAAVYGDVQATDDVEFSGFATVCGEGVLKLSDTVCIRGNAEVRGGGVIGGSSVIRRGYFRGRMSLLGADLSESSHILRIGPVGSESHDAIIYRTSGEAGHVIKIGCWSGVVNDLAEEVKIRAEEEWYGATEDTKEFWKGQYVMVEMMARHNISRWKAEGE